MTDPTTVSVLADGATLVLVALVLGVGAYKAMRALRPQVVWNYSGQVFVRPFRGADAAAVAAVALMIWYALQVMANGEQAQETAEATLAAASEAAVRGDAVAGMLGNIAFLLLVCGFLLFYLRQIRGLDPVELFGLRQMSALRAVGVAVVFLVITLPVVWLVGGFSMQWLQQYWPELGPQETVKLFVEEGVAGKIIMAIAAVVVAPLVEETLFRGFVYGVVKRFTDSYFAALVSALLFSMAHFDLGSAIPLFLLALSFTGAYERTGSLLVPICMHAMFNASSLIALLVYGGDP